MSTSLTATAPVSDLTPPAAGGPVIAIIGAGWLGLPLGRALRADGCRVRATTTSAARLPALAAAGLEAYQLALEPDSAAAAWAPLLTGADAVVISLPPGMRGGADPAAVQYTARLARLGELAAAAGVKKVVLLSSTAVYPETPGVPVLTARAADPTHPLTRAEAVLAATLPPATTLVVARLGGLMGPGRAPGKFYGPGRPVPQPAAPVNLLHLTDAVGAVRALLRRLPTTAAAGGAGNDSGAASGAGNPSARAAAA